jgi:uncharacterized protein YraI
VVNWLHPWKFRSVGWEEDNLVAHPGEETMRRILIVLGLMLWAGSVQATSGPGCLIVTNVAANDALNMRAGPGASYAVVDVLPPGNHGIIHLDGPCVPKSVSPRSRWCKVSHYNGDKVTKGWIKRRYTRDSDCP